MKATLKLLTGIVAVGLVVGCSSVKSNEELPDINIEKCEACHMLPPQDSAKVIRSDSNMIGIHYYHVSIKSFTCNICHFGYDNVTNTWALAENHRTDSLRYDSSRCVKCHIFKNCNNPECHTSPASTPPLRKTIHDLHVKKVDAAGDTIGYPCGYCHKGYDYDLGNKTSPLDLPDNHANKELDVIFDFPRSFPTDPVALPTYDNSSGVGKCNNIYCHGTTITGGKKTVSMRDPVDTVGNAECNYCHDTLILATGLAQHAQEDHSDNFKDCLNCHEGYLLKSANINKKHHINGKINIESCSNCHKDELPFPYFMTADSTIDRLR